MKELPNILMIRHLKLCNTRYKLSGLSICICHANSEVVELGFLCSKNSAFNDLSVSPIYEASQEPHGMWYTSPTTRSFIILCFDFTIS